MNRFLLIRAAVRQKDAFSGIVSGLGALLVEIAYNVFIILLGIKLFRQGTYYQLFKRAGEEKRISRQAANVLGTLVYAVIVIGLLPIVNSVSAKIFGG